jgi:hypothetical protein
MCELHYTIEEIINHPKLSDDYKFSYIGDMVEQEEFCD